MKDYSFAKVKTRPFPTKVDVLHPYIFGGIRSVINVSEKEDKEIVSLYQSLGISHHHFPTKEECEEMIGVTSRQPQRCCSATSVKESPPSCIA